MAISPWYVGATLPAASITLTYDSGTVVNLTGFTSATLKFVNQADGSSFTGAGTATFSNPAGGVIAYAWAASDVATEGRYVIEPTAIAATGSLRCDPIPWTLLP